VKTILEASTDSSAPKYVKGKVTGVKEFVGGRRYGIGKEPTCVGIKIKFT
jgi:hypothetical protein